MSLDVEIVQAGPWRFAFAPHKGAYDGIAESIQKAAGWAVPKGLIGPDTMVAGIYYDNPNLTPVEELRSAGGLSVPDGVAIDGDGLEEVVVPSGRAAKVTHTGPYTTLGETYAKFWAWLEESGERLVEGAPILEHYVDDPTATPADSLRTFIYVALA